MERVGRVGMGSLWMVVLIVVVGMVESGVTQIVNLEDSLMGLCDFHFMGHGSVPPIVDLQNPGLNALSSSIIASDGRGLITAETGKECVLPGLDGGESDSEEIAAVCAEYFHMEQDKMLTTAQTNVTDLCMTGLKGRQVILPLTAVDFLDGTQLRQADGNLLFPESRRCVSFFTATDIATVLDKVLNKAHRKKLSKIGVSAQNFRSDFNELLNNILQFAQ